MSALRLLTVQDGAIPEESTYPESDAIQPEWSHLPKDRVFNAAQVDNVESTEVVRQALVSGDGTPWRTLSLFTG